MGALTFPQLRAANLGRNTEQHWMPIDNWSLDDWLTALGGEVGEALNVVKKLNRVRDNLTGNSVPADQLVPMLANELADAVIYADLLAARFGVLIDNRDFGEFREASLVDLRRRIGRQSPGRMGCTSSLLAMGTVAGIVADTEDGLPLKMSAGIGIGRLVRELDILALHFDIDLGAAVARVFNAKSAALGFPQRLEVA